VLAGTHLSGAVAPRFSGYHPVWPDPACRRELPVLTYFVEKLDDSLVVLA